MDWVQLRKYSQYLASQIKMIKIYATKAHGTSKGQILGLLNDLPGVIGSPCSRRTMLDNVGHGGRWMILRVNKVISGPKYSCWIQSCTPPAGRRWVVLLTSPRGSSLSRFEHLAWHFELISPWLVTGPGKCCALLLYAMCNLPRQVYEKYQRTLPANTHVSLRMTEALSMWHDKTYTCFCFF